MRFREAAIQGVCELVVTPVTDERGVFGRTYCRAEFEAHGLNPTVAQCSFSRNTLRGTLRGMHYQRAPWEEEKLIRCVRGRVFDVALDLRPDSSTYCKWIAFELSADEPRSVYLPGGIAHGFITLTDDAELFYQVSVPHEPTAARAVRWDDPVFGIVWPLEPTVMSDKDRSCPDYLPLRRASSDAT